MQVDDSKYSILKLDFNENPQIVIKSIIPASNAGDPLPKLINRLFKNCIISEPISTDYLLKQTNPSHLTKVRKPSKSHD